MDFVSDTTKILSWSRRRLWGELGGLPQFSAINWFLWNSWKRGWKSVLCFLSSLLIPRSSCRRESCLRIHGPCGNGATPPPALFRPLSTLSCRAWLILCLVMVGRLQAFSKPFAGWTSKLQGYRDLKRWEKMRSTASKDCEGFTSAFSSLGDTEKFVVWRGRRCWLEKQSHGWSLKSSRSWWCVLNLWGLAMNLLWFIIMSKNNMHYITKHTLSHNK